jgi:hypothetical protein
MPSITKARRWRRSPADHQVEQRRRQRRARRPLLDGIAQRDRRHRRQYRPHQPEQPAAHQRHVQARNRQNMRQPRIAQRAFIFVADAPARPGDQRRGDAPVRARQRRLDAPRHLRPQLFDMLAYPLHHAGRPRRHDHPGPAIDKAGGADGLEIQAAPDVRRPRLDRRRRGVQLGGQADPVARMQIAAAPQRHPHPARRLAGCEGSRTDILQYQPHTLFARLQPGNARRQMRDDRMIQNRRRDPCLARLGQAETQQQRRQQGQRQPPPTDTGDQQGEGRRRKRGPAQTGGRFKRQRKIQRRARAKRHRQPQRPAPLFPTPEHKESLRKHRNNCPAPRSSSAHSPLKSVHWTDLPLRVTAHCQSPGPVLSPSPS